jgi:hypothetical protein
MSAKTDNDAKTSDKSKSTPIKYLAAATCCYDCTQWLCVCDCEKWNCFIFSKMMLILTQEIIRDTFEFNTTQYKHNTIEQS